MVKIDAILFDMDDTIIHSTHIWDEVIKNFVGAKIYDYLEKKEKISPEKASKEYVILFEIFLI